MAIFTILFTIPPQFATFPMPLLTSKPTHFESQNTPIFILHQLQRWPFLGPKIDPFSSLSLILIKSALTRRYYIATTPYIFLYIAYTSPYTPGYTVAAKCFKRVTPF